LDSGFIVGKPETLLARIKALKTLFFLALTVIKLHQVIGSSCTWETSCATTANTAEPNFVFFFA
jgi:hypothetical protein